MHRGPAALRRIDMRIARMGRGLSGAHPLGGLHCVRRFPQSAAHGDWNYVLARLGEKVWDHSPKMHPLFAVGFQQRGRLLILKPTWRYGHGQCGFTPLRVAAIAATGEPSPYVIGGAATFRGAD